MSTKVNVFISHAGEDKATIAFPLHDALKEHSISAFVDQRSLRYGENAEKEIIRQMETAPIGIFILSHEFLAKRWPMRELLCFLRRVDTAERQMVKPPLLIPVFYRMTFDQCTSTDLFKATGKDNKSVFEELGFNDRWGAGETSRKQVSDAISRLCKFVGVENLEAASNVDNDDMSMARSRLIQRIASTVRKTALPHPATESTLSTSSNQSGSYSDRFVRQYPDSSPSRSHVLDFNSREKEGGEFSTAEGKLKAFLMSSMSQTGDVSTAAICGNTPHAFSAVGMGGVGKSTAIIGIAWERDVQDAFSDGIYFISAGAEADEECMVQRISRVVEKSGGSKLASHIRAATDLERGVDRASPWFEGKKILLLLDDLWETKSSALGFFPELRRLVSPAGRILVTTRSSVIAQAAGLVVYFDAFNPSSNESRRMLLRYAGLDANLVSSRDIDVSIHLKEILGRCAGLPLALGIAGCAIREIMERDGVSWEDAVHTCSTDLEQGEQSEYEGLRHTMKVSLAVADCWFEREPLFNSSHSVRPPSELYERFSVLRKQNRISVAVLSRLWDTNNTTQARVIAKKLSSLSLLSREGNQYKLHDLLMDLCTTRAACNGKLQSYHDSFLKAFLRDAVKGEKSLWRCIDKDCDNYLRENLARHLVGSDRLDELHELLVNARWTMRRIRGGNYLSWQNDFAEFLSGIDRKNRDKDSKHGRKSRKLNHGMKLVERAVSLAWGRLEANPSELAFQIIGRLGSRFCDFPDVCNFVKSATELATKPWLKPEQRCLPGPESRIVLTVAMEAPVDAIAIDKSAHFAYVGLKGGISVVDLHSRQIVKLLDKVGLGTMFLAISGDGRRGVCKRWNYSAQLWEADGVRLREVGKPLETDGGIKCAAISHNGKRMALGVLHKVVLVRDAEKRLKMSEPLEGHRGMVTCVDLTEDGKWIVSGSTDMSLRVWDTVHMRQKGDPLQGHTDEVTCLALLRHKKAVVSGSMDRTLRIWDMEGMRQIGNPLKGHTGNVLCVAVSHDERILVSGSSDGTLRVWDRARMCEVGEPLEGHTRWVSSVAISRDGKWIISGSGDQTVRVWDVGQIFHQAGQARGRSPEVSSVALVEAGAGIAPSLEDRTPVMPHAKQICEETRIPYLYRDVSCLKISKDGAKIVFGFPDGSLRIWDVDRRHDVSGRLLCHSRSVSCVELTDDGKWMVSGSVDGTLCRWNVKSMSCVGKPQKVHDRAVECLSISPDGKRIVSTAHDMAVWAWDEEHMHKVGRALGGDAKSVTRVRISDDGERIVASSRERVVSWWDAERVRQLGPGFKIGRSVRGIHFLEENLVLCVTLSDNVLLRNNGEKGLAYVDYSELSNEDRANINSSVGPVIQGHGRGIWMEFPRERLLGKLEDWIWACTFVQTSNTVVTCQRGGQVTKFRLMV